MQAYNMEVKVECPNHEGLKKIEILIMAPSRKLAREWVYDILQMICTVKSLYAKKTDDQIDDQ